MHCSHLINPSVTGDPVRLVWKLWIETVYEYRSTTAAVFLLTTVPETKSLPSKTVHGFVRARLRVSENVRSERETRSKTRTNYGLRLGSATFWTTRAILFFQTFLSRAKLKKKNYLWCILIIVLLLYLIILHRNMSVKNTNVTAKKLNFLTN
jgi:hypothetical protein